MATVSRHQVAGRVLDDEIEYPSGDGRPMAETPVHFDNLTNLVKTLRRWFAADGMTYVAGNMFVYYSRGDRNKSLAPDVYVVRGVPRDKEWRTYKVWEEGGHMPDLVIELTSRSTQEEDVEDKFFLYQDVLRVRELFLFDPMEEYLEPRFQGHRLYRGRYVAIQPIEGRLPSKVTGLHFEAHGRELRLYDPKAGRWLPWADEGWAEAEAALARVDEERRRQELDISSLRRELESLRRSRPANQ